MMRAAFAVVSLCLWSAACLAQVPTEADDRAQQALVASTWSGQILGVPVSGYLLDEALLILKVGNEQPREARWGIRAGKFESSFLMSEQVVAVLRAEVRGDTMVGTADAARTSPFELHKDPKPNPQLLAVAPPNRPHPPAPRADPREFDGVYEMDLPERVGEKSPLVKNRLTCKGGKCILAVGKDEAAIYDKLGVIRPSHFAHARYALKFAMDHKANAQEEAPYIVPLLASGANLQSCIDLGSSQGYEPGMTVLCKVDRNPWKAPAVLLMGSIIGSCGQVFCRYEIVPLVRR
jgi:hypothetical protein